MIIYTDKGDYYCALLGENEYPKFATARSTCFLDKTPNDLEGLSEEYLKAVQGAIREDAVSYWKGVFDAQGGHYFVVYRRNDHAEDEPVAIGDLRVVCNGEDSFASFETIHVLKIHRGQGLSSLIYESLLKLSCELGLRQAQIGVEPQNEPSIKPAEKNGFKFQRRIENYDGEPLNIYTRDIP